jgi:hypothetical protein
MALSLNELAIQSRKEHILKKLEDIDYFIEDIKEKTNILSQYSVDYENIYQQIYNNLLSFYDEYNEQLKQLDDSNIINRLGIIQIIVYQKISEKRIKKEMKQYIKMFYELYSQVKELMNLPLSN